MRVGRSAEYFSYQVGILTNFTHSLLPLDCTLDPRSDIPPDQCLYKTFTRLLFTVSNSAKHTGLFARLTYIQVDKHTSHKILFCSQKCAGKAKYRMTESDVIHNIRPICCISNFTRKPSQLG